MLSCDIKQPGPAPIIINLCEQLGIKETVNSVVPWDEKQCLLDPGTLVLALIVNILCRRDPLYRIKEFYEEQDVELLFGNGVEISNFNDSAFGHTLDKIFEGGPAKFFSSVSLKAQTREDINYRVLHGDTTARLTYGAYPKEEDGVLNVTYGYNKEHRNLKQFKIGLVVTEEGYPVIGEVLDGNLDDKTWNKKLLGKLPKHFTLDELKKIIYVADSALVTEDNLKAMGDGRPFISRMPYNFNLPFDLIRAAFIRDKWEELGKLSDSRKGAEYKLQEFVEELYGRKYRFVVVHSSHLDKRKLKGLNSRLKKQKAKLEKIAKKQMKLSFACSTDANDALNRFLREHQNDFYPLSGSIEKNVEKVKRNQKGRPANGELPEYRDLYNIQLQVGELDEQAFEVEKELLSCFVLISNVFEDYSSRDLLKEYKEQSVVENRFKFVKSPLYVGPLWLQKNERLEALCYVILLALAVYIILQRRVRNALLYETEPLTLTGNKKSYDPTGNKILELLLPVKVVILEEEDGTKKRLLPERYLVLNRVVKMLGFDMDIFIKPRSP